jgi:hypothetical protein
MRKRGTEPFSRGSKDPLPYRRRRQQSKEGLFSEIAQDISCLTPSDRRSTTRRAAPSLKVGQPYRGGAGKPRLPHSPTFGRVRYKHVAPAGLVGAARTAVLRRAATMAKNELALSFARCAERHLQNPGQHGGMLWEHGRFRKDGNLTPVEGVGACVCQPTPKRLPPGQKPPFANGAPSAGNGPQALKQHVRITVETNVAPAVIATNVHLRRIHNFALDMSRLPWPVLPPQR